MRPHKSTISGRTRRNFSTLTFQFPDRKPVYAYLDAENGGAFAQVQDQWAVVSDVYDKLRDRYRRDRRARAARQNVHWTTAPMQDPEWRPQRGTALSSTEILCLAMTKKIIVHKSVRVENVEFHTQSSQRGRVHDDSVVKSWFLDPDTGEEVVAYGIIKRIFEHQMYFAGPKDVILECEWLDSVPDLNDNEEGSSFLPRVRRNPDSNFNRRSRFTFLRKCAGYNIMLAKSDPWNAECDLLDVIDSWRKYQDHSEHFV
jgi:hypothetical protein